MAVLRGWVLKLDLFFFLENVRKNEDAYGVRRQRVFEATPLCLTAGSESSSATPMERQCAVCEDAPLSQTVHSSSGTNPDDSYNRWPAAVDPR